MSSHLMHWLLNLSSSPLFVMGSPKREDETGSFQYAWRAPGMFTWTSVADKGGQIVVMDKPTYIAGVSKLINEGPYCSIPKDPSTSDLTKVKTTIESSHILPTQLKKSLIPPIANCARLYVLPKVHKTGIPFRPIETNCQHSQDEVARPSFEGAVEGINKLKDNKAPGSDAIPAHRVSVHTERPIGDYQSGFRIRRPSIEQMFNIQHVMEKKKEFEIDTHHLFFDFKAAYDSITRKALITALREFKIPRKLFKIITQTLDETKIMVKIQNELSKPPEIKNGMQQGDTSTCLLINLPLEK
ncbi:hypothetical protein X975_01150, partial [Stegodyphus mimosarum]